MIASFREKDKPGSPGDHLRAFWMPRRKGRGGPGGVGEKLKSRPSEGKGWERAPWNLTASLPQFLPHRTLVCGDRAGTITAQGLWGWGRGGATAKWPELEKAAFGS